MDPKVVSRKRRSHQWEGELPSQKRFASSKGQDRQGGVWSDFETILLQEIYNVHKSVEDITVIFDKLAIYSRSLVCSVPLPDNVVFREKSELQITSKLAHLVKVHMLATSYHDLYFVGEHASCTCGWQRW